MTKEGLPAPEYKHVIIPPERKERSDFIKQRWEIYAVTEMLPPDVVTFLQTVEKLFASGVTVLQLRDKLANQDMLRNVGAELCKLAERYEACLIVNDDPSLAIDVRAAGVHLGQSDMPVAAARKRLGKEAVIGVSVHSTAEAFAALQAGADYIAVNGVFPSASKQVTPLGLETVSAIRSAFPDAPILGIGGITPANARQVIQAGADGIAMISALFKSKDIPATVAHLQTIIHQAKNSPSL